MRPIAAILALFALGLLPAVASAADPSAAPVIRPAASWVVPVPIPAPSPKQGDKPLQVLLVDAQSHYGKDGLSESYIEVATKVQTPQGLSAVGNVVIPWQPDNNELIVHKVAVLRDGKTIDLLGNGEKFTILRRENNLESATLDGVLTAVLQPEGLVVGDVVSVAWTIRQKPRTIAFKPENMVLLPPTPFFARHAFYRETWDKGVAMRWHATPAIGKPQLKTNGQGSELILDLQDAAGPTPPDGAPARYRILGSLEVSAYGDWSEISRLFAPLFATAQELAPDSPLKAEIARIAAASPDPAVRAMVALRLVQDKVRYLALAMGDGGYTPATADQTWTRKFGDCKGKTSLLLALLSGLGIEAEPVLVNSEFGDALRERLPIVRLFDHVLVRAHIGGRAYWLDGTRVGDRNLDDLASTRLGWGLAVTEAGSTLEKLPLLPPRQALQERRITFDASKGFSGPVPISGEIVYRGDQATLLRLGMAQAGKAQAIEYLKGMNASLPGADTADQFDVKADEDLGTLTFLYSGKGSMSWTRAPGTRALRYQFDDNVVSWSPDFDRPAGQSQDAPFLFDSPFYLTETQTVILPLDGKGFTADAQAFSRLVAGVEISREVKVEGGRAIARSTFRRLQPEVTAADGKAAAPMLKQVNDDHAYVKSPDGYQSSLAERSALLTLPAKTADEYLRRGHAYLQASRLDEALADFDKAAELEPNSARAHANRGIVLVYQRKYDLAKSALDKSAALADDDSVTWQGFGLLAMAQSRPRDAAEALTRSLALEPEDLFSLATRASAFTQLGRMDEAAADLEKLARVGPDVWQVLPLRASLEAFRGRHAQALALADSWIAAKPAEYGPKVFKAMLLKQFDRSAEAAPLFLEALALYDKETAKAPADAAEDVKANRAELLAESGQVTQAIAILDQLVRAHPVGQRYLNQRCWMRGTANRELQLALADCDKAVKIAPNAAVVDSRGLIELRLGRLDEAIKDYDEAIRRAPQQAASYYGRGLAHLAKGEHDQAEADLATARRLDYDIDSRFKSYGLGAESPGHPK